MEMLITPSGQIRCIYDEAVDLASLGAVEIRRASVVEPDEGGRWWADLSPVQGPRIGPFVRRSAALAAEIAWLETQLSLPTRNLKPDDATASPRPGRRVIHFRGRCAVDGSSGGRGTFPGDVVAAQRPHGRPQDHQQPRPVSYRTLYPVLSGRGLRRLLFSQG